jgi:hypothetical protein
MAKNESVEGEPTRIKQVHPTRPDWDYYALEPSKDSLDELIKAPVFEKTCDKACTQTIALLPRTNVAGHTGVGYQMINIDGYRMINAYVISDRLNSTTQRGFTLELSFSVHPFVIGTGVVGETSFFFNFDSYFEPGTLSHRVGRCETSDLTTVGGLPRIGGVDLTHILRAPVMGPYVRASVFNEDTAARNVQVLGYLST